MRMQGVVPCIYYIIAFDERGSEPGCLLHWATWLPEQTQVLMQLLVRLHQSLKQVLLLEQVPLLRVLQTLPVEQALNQHCLMVQIHLLDGSKNPIALCRMLRHQLMLQTFL